MLYEIETKEGKKTIEGLMYIRIKDIHGNEIREGDTVRVKEYYNREEEIVVELGGEYWTKKGLPGKDYAMGYELCTKEELKGELIQEYEGIVELDQGIFYVKVINPIFNRPKQRAYVKGEHGPCLSDDICGKYTHPLFDFEIIERKQL